MRQPEMSVFASTIVTNRYAHDVGGRKETWPEIARRVGSTVLGAVGATQDLVEDVVRIITERKFLPGGRYLYATGRKYHQTNNCLLLRAEDSREGWGRHMNNITMSLMTGAGVGTDYSALREEGSVLHSGGGVASGPLALMQMTNEAGRGARQGGDRRGAMWAGLNWRHQDVFKFIHAKDWPEEVRALKAKNVNYPAYLDYTNISVLLDDEFFLAYHDTCHPRYAHARRVYWETVRQMCATGEPGFSIDVGVNTGETLRNACTEVCSRDDSDICNLGSINLARIESQLDMERTVQLGTIFLLAGTVYSDVPYQKVRAVREKNRRLGLGLMGLHEWLLSRGKRYGPDEELGKLLDIYSNESRDTANYWASRWNLSRPEKVRAIAPNGTIGIAAETTTSAEPIFAAAYKRRYSEQGDRWNFQYVVDPTAKRLVASGVNPDAIEDAYTLASDVERRVAFQAWLQGWVDHGIASTINLPAWGSEHNNEDRARSFGEMLLRYLPELRGITVYPDGARDGQPLTKVPLREALEHEGEVFEEAADVCDRSRGASCGS